MGDASLIRWGMIGCGDVTERKSAPAYQQTPGFELSAVMARSLSKAQNYANRHGISRVFDDAYALINDPNINAIYIATPPDSHLDYALAVAAAGKPCCVEKPMAVTYSQALQMQRAFEAAQVPLFVAYYRRCLPGFIGIKGWLEQGLIGSIRHVDWQYHRTPSELDRSGQYNWRTDASIAPGGYFDDLASHGLNALTFLLGPIAKAQGIATNQQALYSAKDAVVANLLFESGCTGNGCWNFAANHYQDSVTIYGEKGQIQFGIFSDKDAILTSDERQQFCAMPKPEPIQGHFVQAMADHLAGRVDHPSLADSAAHTNWVMEQILGPSVHAITRI